MGIKEICNTLQTLLDNYSRKPFQAISGLIMICSLSKRPGLSPILSTANIIKNVAARGINTAPMEDGSPNQLNIVINEITKEVFRAMREDANIQTAFGPGSITTLGNGANAGGPVVVTSKIMNYAKGVAAIF